MIYQFNAERDAAKVPGLSADLKPQPIRSAAVIGAGTMGGGIAMCFANAGIPVRLLDASAEGLARGRALIEKNYATSVSRGSLTQPKMDRALSLITPTLAFGEIADCDIVIEAAFEDMTVKQDIFRKLDAVMKPGAILATNTSTLDIDQIASATERPESVIGAHFFSPANVMKLLEVVRAGKTSPQTIVTTMALAKTLGKVGVLAGNADGFIGNRILARLRPRVRLPARGRRDAVAGRPRAAGLRLPDGPVPDARHGRARRRLAHPQVPRAVPRQAACATRRSPTACASATASARRPAPATTSTTAARRRPTRSSRR